MENEITRKLEETSLSRSARRAALNRKLENAVESQIFCRRDTINNVVDIKKKL